MTFYIITAVVSIPAVLSAFFAYIQNREKIKSFIAEKRYTIHKTIKTIKTIQKRPKKKRVRAELIDIVRLEIDIFKDILEVCHIQHNKPPPDDIIAHIIEKTYKKCEKLETKLKTIENGKWEGILPQGTSKISYIQGKGIIEHTPAKKV